MDWQLIADTMGAMTCIVSIEKFENGEYGNYCIVSGNKAYVDSIEHPAPGAEMLTDKFTPGLEYTTYLTRDLNFENACFEAAVNKKCVHSYVSPSRFGVWFNMTFLPLNSDEDNKFYCSYTMEISFEAESEKMTKLSGEISGAVLDTCIKLRGTTDFKSTIKDVVNDIREICDSEHCCILLMDDINRRCEVLGEAFSEGSKLLPMDRYLDENFYNIADSWESTVIAGSNCLIAKDDRDMDV
ncbi:MAG: GGDEF domain-containing protein, partial [Eubacterium sp.]|nr:GGDEF domain-containing protein [Eubacterium sp.]